MASYKQVSSEGVIRWHKIGTTILHRTDGPALIFSHGREDWYINGERHRVGAPAITWDNVREDWYQNGIRHRLDGPATVWADGSEEWYQNAMLHSVDGPAVTFLTEEEDEWQWLYEDKPHRLDGPAHVWTVKATGITYSYFHLFGFAATEEEFTSFRRILLHNCGEAFDTIPHEVLKSIYMEHSQENLTCQNK